jgi:uncharacterized protein YecE (DUF72 family)
VTADFVYMRLHGSSELYRSRYSDDELDRWAARVDAWRRGTQVTDARVISPQAPRVLKARDVYCYFDNTDKLQAPKDAVRLIERLAG